MLEIIVNKEAYEALPSDLQAIVKYGARAVNQEMLDWLNTEHPDELNDFLYDFGITQLKSLNPTPTFECLLEILEILP